MATIASILVDGQDPSMPALRAWLQSLEGAVSLAAQGIKPIPTIAARDTFYATEANRGTLVYVNNNNGSANDPANGVYEYVGGARLAQSFYAGLVQIVQALVDKAQAWAESGTAPGGAGTKSAKTIAGEVAAIATPLAGVAQVVRSVTNDLTPAADALDFLDADGRVLFALGGGGLPREAGGFAAAIGGAAGVNNTLAAIAALPRHGRLFTSVDWWGLTIAGQSNGASQSGSVLPTPPSLGNKRLVGNALVDIVETANESCATGAVNHATDALLKRLSPLPQSTYPQQWVVFNMSQGGASLAEIKKGTSAYNAGLAAVQKRRDLALAAGKTYAERGLVFIGGETNSNNGTTQAAFYAEFIQYKNDWIADVMAITGQADRIPIFIVQVALGDAFSTTSGPALAMLQAVESDPDCYAVSAAYALTFREDGLHATPHDQRGGTGEPIGKALNRFYIDGKSPNIVRPLSWKMVDARTIDVDFYVPVPPLVMDIVHVWPGDAGMGFAVYDSSGPEIPVIGARVVGPRTVRITTGADVSLTDRITYAIKKYTRGLTGGIGAGRRKGARGCLRDSDLTASLYRDAKGRLYPLHNWCAAFDKILETRA